MASRRRARERALQMLFQWDIAKDPPELIEELFWGNRKGNAEDSTAAANAAPAGKAPRKRKGAAKKNAKVPKTVPLIGLAEMHPDDASKRDEPLDARDDALRAYANGLFRGTIENAREIDMTIRRHAEHWRLERMPVVDRNILRLAIYEMNHRPETPPAVVINEALEIARKFSEEDSVAFINGLLDQVRKEAEIVPQAP